ncbi:MAG TPA: DJ-1/PfpI family protein [Patescibacteria group bacterium]|nr:DJ-1/PfpI family protein [Patescibacteria group bacterium]
MSKPVAQGAESTTLQERPRSVSVIILLGEWFGDAYFPLQKEIEGRGWKLKRVGVDAEYRGCYKKERDIVLRSDILIPDLKDFSGYDCLIIPSGPQFRKFNENPAVLQFVRDAHSAGLLLASFCTGNMVVKAAGLIDQLERPALFPGQVTLVAERILLGPRGGGPPPGDGFRSAPVEALCDAVAMALAGNEANETFPILKGAYLGQKPPGMTPELFAAGIVSGQGNQAKLFLTPDGGEIIFASMQMVPGQGNDPSARDISFISIKRVDGIWRKPSVLPFSRDFINDEPCLSHDGKRLFFVSNRPKDGCSEPEKMPDIWMVNRVEGEWSKPRNAGEPVNTDEVEVQPFYSIDDKLYFCRRDGVYYSQFSGEHFLPPVKLDENTFKGRLSGICISPDNNTLIVHSNMAGGLGGWDLYASFRGKTGEWSSLINIGAPVNSAESEGNATFSPDGKYLFFSRGGDIYWISAKIMDGLRSKE